MTETKQCTKCREVKPREMFSKFKHAKDGLKIHCKACVRLHRIKTVDARAAYEGKYKRENKRQTSIVGAAYREKNKEQISAYQTAYREANRALLNEKRAIYCQSNPDKVRISYLKHDSGNRDRRRAATASWAAANPDKVAAYRISHRAEAARRVAAWTIANPTRVTANKARRRAIELMATPAWAESEDLEDFYVIARMFRMYTGLEYHVDHIVPLQNKLVCGLHCEANLQVLPGPDNRSKSNRHWPDMP